MRAIIATMIVFALLSSVVFAAQGIDVDVGGNDNGEQNMEQIESQETAQSENVVQAQNMEQLREMEQNEEQKMNQEMSSMSSGEQKVYQNQNAVRLAVHNLLSMENMTGGIGPQVSAIAREFNNSVQNTIRAEEKIQTRSRISKFFFGGDSEAADEIEAEVTQNQIRLQELNQLYGQCNCSSEVKAMLNEQIQSMEQEQTRLQELTQTEKESKGLFGRFRK